MIDNYVHGQIGNHWEFKYADPDLNEVPKFQVLNDFPASWGNKLRDTLEIFFSNSS